MEEIGSYNQTKLKIMISFTHVRNSMFFKLVQLLSMSSCSPHLAVLHSEKTELLTLIKDMPHLQY